MLSLSIAALGVGLKVRCDPSLPLLTVRSAVQREVEALPRSVNSTSHSHARVSFAHFDGPFQADPPKFGSDFYVGEQSALGINQGGYYANDRICCSMEHSSQCKLQALNMGSDVYEQGSSNRSRSDSIQGAIVRWYGSVNKEMAVAPGDAVNSTHKWACVQYCPIKKGDHFMPSLQIGDGSSGPLDTPKDLGAETVTHPKSIGGDSKKCEHWHWSETLLKIIKMETSDMYVDQSGAKPSPFFMKTFITPFGKPLGQQNVSYIGYKEMDVADYFDIDLDPKICKMSTKCNPPPAPPSGAVEEAFPADNIELLHEKLLESLAPYEAARRRLFPTKTVFEAAAEEAKANAPSAPAPAMAPLPPQPNITFVDSFTAKEDSINVINQGGTMINGDPCCSSDSPAPQCQIQLQHRAGMRYMDLDGQRSRFDDTVSGENVVDDFNVMKSMLINVTDGVDTCQEYCPIKQGDKLFPFHPFDPFDKTVDKGATTMEGKKVEHYHWADKILKIITMSTTDFYADITDPKAAVPVFMTQHLSPLGQDLGRQNITWSSYTPGKPDAKKFKIAGVDTCPMSKQCQSNKKVMHHMASGHFHTLASIIEHRPQHAVMPATA